MIRAVLIAVVLLTGCASYSEMQARAPTLEWTTEKTPGEFVSCAAPKLMTYWETTKVIPDGETKVISVPLRGGGMLMTITVTPVGDGSRVAYRQMNRPIAGEYTAAIEAVRSCS